MKLALLLVLVACERASEAPLDRLPPPGPTKLVVDASLDAPLPDAPVDAVTQTDEVREVIDILSPRGGHYDPRRARVFDPAWDVRRAWLTELIQDGQTFTLHGHAYNANDLSQFRDRLKASRLFRDVLIHQVDLNDDFNFRLTFTAPGADEAVHQRLDQQQLKRP